MAVIVHAEGTATRFGWWLGQAVRLTLAALLLGGLLGAALGAARTASLPEVLTDLDSGRATEVVFTDSQQYAAPDLDRGGSHPVVRWKVAGSGWRTAALSTTGASDALGDDLLDGGRDTAVIEDHARAAGVPFSTGGGGAAHTLISLASVTSLLLVLVLIGGPQPRRATKWAWFWFLLVPGGIGLLAWLAVEAPWSSGANRRPEPLPHARQDGDTRLTGGRAFAFAVVAGLLVAGLGTVAAGWLAG